MSDSLQDIGFLKILSGVAGSVVSLRFVKGTILEKLLMSIGGSALSYFGTSPAATWIGMANAEGLVGFLIGLFGMAIASKVYEVIQVIDAPGVAKEFTDWITRKRGP